MVVAYVYCITWFCMHAIINHGTSRNTTMISVFNIRYKNAFNRETHMTLCTYQTICKSKWSMKNKIEYKGQKQMEWMKKNLCWYLSTKNHIGVMVHTRFNKYESLWRNVYYLQWLQWSLYCWTGPLMCKMETVNCSWVLSSDFSETTL
jgi:hypothetical protein